MSDFSTTIILSQSPSDVFNAINHVRGWWSEEIEGSTTKLHDEFKYQFEDVHHCDIKLIEFIEHKKIVWLLKYNYFKFTKDKNEWTGTKISFEISEKNNHTEMCFTHHGLVSDLECFEICSKAWSQYIQKSLFNLITTGKGQPNGKNKPTTADEKKMSSR